MAPLQSTLDLSEGFLRCLGAIAIWPRRMQLEMPGVQASVSMLRGVWGAALHDLDQVAYRHVFQVEQNRAHQIPLGPSMIAAW